MLPLKTSSSEVSVIETMVLIYTCVDWSKPSIVSCMLNDITQWLSRGLTLDLKYVYTNDDHCAAN